jgi:hypothetical protein
MISAVCIFTAVKKTTATKIFRSQTIYYLKRDGRKSVLFHLKFELIVNSLIPYDMAEMVTNDCLNGHSDVSFLLGMAY